MYQFIRFGNEFDGRRYLGSGWAAPEPGIVWSNAQRSTINIPAPTDSADYVLSLLVEPFVPPAQRYQVTAVSVNGSVVGECVLRHKVELDFYVSNHLAKRGGAVEVAFYNQSPLKPSDVVPNSKDERSLSFALIELKLYPLKSEIKALALDENLLFADDDVGAALHRERVEDVRIVNGAISGGGAAVPSLPVMVEHYLKGAGSVMQIRRRIMDAIRTAVSAQGEGAETQDPFFPNGQIRPEVVRTFAEPFEHLVLHEGDHSVVSEIELLPASPNEARFANFPVKFGSGIVQEIRPSLTLLSCDRADAYVHPYHFAIYDRINKSTWRGTNPQQVSRVIMSESLVEHAGAVVIVQDQFDGGNLSHFLFDDITRMYHFCEHEPVLAKTALFIFGGWPGSFHRLIIRAAAEDLGLNENQCYFPRRGFNIRPKQKMFWFSDQGKYRHPAQMMHPRSVAVLRRLSSALGFRGEHTGRLYISRSDAGLRRLANEDELTQALTKLSFRVVRLADLPGEEQMRLVSNALCVVAPHGMGLTHLALHLGKPTVVELFNPLIGSDAYAFMSRAYGFDYHPIVGEQVDAQKRDFVVKVSDVLDALAASEISGPLNADAR